jgi:hypothetical protein
MYQLTVEVHRASKNLEEPPQNSGRQKGGMKQVTCQGCTVLGATIQKLGAKDFCSPGVDIETNCKKIKIIIIMLLR